MTNDTPPGGTIAEPFPIFLVANRYMLYDVNVVSYIRRVYHMCGCLIGTLPQVPQQNVFLGLPLELMVEEAALLVEKGVAYIVDDVAAHKTGREAMLEQDRLRYLAQRGEELKALAEENQREAFARKVTALEKKGRMNLIVGTLGSPRGKEKENEATPTPPASEESNTAGAGPEILPVEPEKAEDTLFSQPQPSTENAPSQDVTFHSTPTTSHSTYHFPTTTPTTPAHLIPQPSPTRFPIYRHLHSKGYFLSPGLRFGAQYMAYPGDPLRFHSHFVVNGLGWDEEISVMDIVGGGRLGTGVKKAWMVGGRDPSLEVGENGGEEDGVRVFSVEWGGF
ncbi:hypothetical protein BGX38DRAFT_1266136 [Terfezia claveryi]|nr:hypothetical protein BGX38DRAFT_1266136 [Terfezia claveryi]